MTDTSGMTRCPTCNSPEPHLHPAVQAEGEVETCPDAFHLKPTPQNRPEYIEGVERKRAGRTDAMTDKFDEMAAVAGAARARAMAQRLQVQENMVRNLLEYGGPLSAQEIADGVRLSHEDFLYLAQLAMSALNRELAASDQHQHRDDD